MKISTAEFFRGHDLAGGGFNESRSSKEYSTLFPDYYAFVGHGWDIGAASRA
jgi:hypothetical protein